MTKLEDIEAAVEKLSPEELRKFRAWFEELEERLFDEKIERDAKALENYRAGRVRDL